MKAAIGQCGRLQIRPESVLYAPWFNARLRKRIAASGQPVIVEQREPRFPIQDPGRIKYADAGVVDMCCKEGHVRYRPVASLPSCAGSTCRCSKFRHQKQVAPEATATGAQETSGKC